MGVDAEHRCVVSGTDCTFCAIVAGRIPASFVLREERVVAFMDLRQAVPGHVLVVPTRHVEEIYSIEEGLAGELMATAVRVARALRAMFAPEGLNLWQSNGEAGGQEVPHVHLHVQPRRRDDGLLRVYATFPDDAERSSLEELAVRIRAGLQ